MRGTPARSGEPAAAAWSITALTARRKRGLSPWPLKCPGNIQVTVTVLRALRDTFTDAWRDGHAGTVCARATAIRAVALRG